MKHIETLHSLKISMCKIVEIVVRNPQRNNNAAVAASATEVVVQFASSKSLAYLKEIQPG